MVPYQLSAARPFQPISWTRARVSPARPVMLVLLKTTTPTSLRSTGGLVVGSSGVVVLSVGSEDSVSVASVPSVDPVASLDSSGDAEPVSPSSPALLSLLLDV